MNAPLIALDFHGTSSGDDSPGTLMFRNPVEVLQTTTHDEIRAVLDNAERATARGLHAVGFVSYEAAPAFDPAFRVHQQNSIPLAWFGVFNEPELIRDLSALCDGTRGWDTPTWTPSVSREQYDTAITAIRDEIAAGGVYQVNHTMRMRARVTGNPLALYLQLRDAQRCGYGAYIDTGRHRIVSASPELFFATTGDHITTRPMKGTARRGRWTEDDDARARALAASEKERAENVMIVDLLRNDLGRIAIPGSVHVDSMFDVERYPTVLQMTSTVSATLTPSATLYDIFSALFPCGSVTGAPKVAATHIIHELEDSPRGVYCGAIGHLSPSGNRTFSVAIRTAWMDSENDTMEYGTGGGITWDSVPGAEFDEALAKAAILTAEPVSDFQLIETLRLEGSSFVRLERHLARLASSARYFGFTFDDAAVRAALDQYAASLQRDTAWRVRLLLSRNGRVVIESAPIPAPSDATQPRTVTLAERPVRADDRFLYHKTTNRAVYDDARAGRQDVFDVLLWNEDGEITEFTIGNVVIELDGELWTPHRECGLLGGILREELLDAGTVHERHISVAELERATGIWLVNSLRGWVPVRIVS